MEVLSFQKLKDVYPLQTIISMMKLFFDKFEQQIFLALTVNCKGQQNCLHTMECNSNDKQDGSKRSTELFKLYLHKAVMRVLEGCF